MRKRRLRPLSDLPKNTGQVSDGARNDIHIFCLQIQISVPSYHPACLWSFSHTHCLFLCCTAQVTIPTAVHGVTVQYFYIDYLVSLQCTEMNLTLCPI